MEVSIFELLDCFADDEQVTLLTPVDYCNIVRNMSLHDTRRTNFVLSEILITRAEEIKATPKGSG